MKYIESGADYHPENTDNVWITDGQLYLRPDNRREHPGISCRRGLAFGIVRRQIVTL